MSDLIPIRLAEQACANLQAEIDRLKEKSACQAECLEAFDKENARLKAEVESLYRHGDLMLKFACANMPYPPYATMAKDWMAVKEGKQS